ncbi:class I SAM-dependent methyltransferase [Robertkochia aurantiaca]|uniref:class I SAM-dependent methyltransferase n=1 Tax=Robertkochia aurantiaca TaxID=2873700 RepID=UPI001CCCADC5|nr:class I SAM-dependent methyltransferase [Robertkochia sp. 3YJGBD-33]
MKSDPMGHAMLDAFHGRQEEPLLTSTSISEEDEFPMEFLFREYDEMPLIEQKALDLSRGSVLDAGCGAGSHALYLQNKRGLEVTAIDTSEAAISVARARGVKNARQGDVFEDTGTYDTLLMLMNGTGLLHSMNKAGERLKKLSRLLAPGGQILIDSSDLIYMYDEDDDGGKWVPSDRYYGELDYTLQYKDEILETSWLYLDFGRLTDLCSSAGLTCELITEGEHYDYLARIMR